MKIRLFTIPNILTLLNLLCGTVALIEIFMYQNMVAAFILIIAAATFDFLDGMMARLLGQYSDIGRELDSLSDVVSFGLVPSMMMFSLFNSADKWIDNPIWGKWGACITFVIVCCSALRLAKFNIDDNQESSFEGLPTPANALFCLSLGVLVECGKLTISAEMVAIISLIMAALLIAPIRFFALKFKNLSWHENKIRYIFLFISAIALFLLREYGIPAIIAIYTVMSILYNIAHKNGWMDE